MAALLAAVRDELKAQVSAVSGRVYVTLDSAAEMRPSSDTVLPYLVVSGSGPDYAWQPGRVAHSSYAVCITAYVQNRQGVEAPLLGDVPSGAVGVEALCASVVSALLNNLLAARVAGVEYALPDGMSDPGYLAEETWWAVTKTVRMRYDMTQAI